MQDAAVVQTPVGIETFNAGLIDHYSAAAAPKIADNLLLSNVGSSDSDVLWTIGQGVTNFHESTVTDLRTALIHRQTVSIPVQMSHGPQLAEGIFFTPCRRVEYSHLPRSPVRLERMSAIEKFTLVNQLILTVPE